METPVLERLPGGMASLITRRSPIAEQSEPNEDSALILPCDRNRAVLAVADGCGGTNSGEVASRITIEKLAEVVRAGIVAERDLRDLILDGFEQANKAVLELSVGAMTTLAVVEVDGSIVRPYHVGDSAIIIMSSRGTIKFQSVAHSPVGYAVEAGVLDEHEALGHADRHLISNVVGSPDMRIDIGSSFTLAQQDSILIASDGLFDNLDPETLITLACKGSPDRSTRIIADAAFERMCNTNGKPSHPDDLTCLLYRNRYQIKK